MPLVSKLTHSRFWHHYRAMLAFEQLPPEAQRKEQWSRFSDLLKHAYDNVPFHRDRMDEAGVKPEEIQSPADLSRIPVSTKREIQKHFPDRTSAENVDKDERSDWTYVSTSGTADRMMAIHDFHKREMTRAAAMRALNLSGGYEVGRPQAEIPPNICNIVCGIEGQKIEGVLSHAWGMFRQKKMRDAAAVSDLRGLIERNWVLRKRTYPPMGMQGTAIPGDKLDEYLAQLRKQKPHVLKALPTYLFSIARRVLERGEAPLPVRVVKPMGASVSPAMRKVIEAGFAGQYREDYGSGEFGDMACDSDRDDGLHVFMDLFLIEVVRDGKPVPDGELGKVVITDLSNFAMPFIRYEIGDVGRMIAEPSGRAAPRLLLEGRMQDTIVNEAGEAFSNDRVMDFFYQREDIAEFQLVEKKPGRFELTVVPRDTEATPATMDTDALAMDVKAFLGQPDARMRVFVSKSIKPEASGKFRFVQSATSDRLDAMPPRPPSDAREASAAAESADISAA